MKLRPYLACIAACAAALPNIAQASIVAYGGGQVVINRASESVTIATQFALNTATGKISLCHATETAGGTTHACKVVGTFTNPTPKVVAVPNGGGVTFVNPETGQSVLCWHPNVIIGVLKTPVGVTGKCIVLAESLP